MKTRFLTAALLCGGALCLLAVGAQEAQAQANGRIYLTKEKVPDDVKGAKLRKLLKKQGLSVLQKEGSADSWTANGFAKLSTRPSAKMMKLEHNEGKIQIIVRKKVKRRWVQVKVGDFEYTDKARIVRFELSLTDTHQIPTGKKHQLQLVVLNKRKKPVVLARATFSVK
ncbi:MAG: hypothetical protein ABI333_26305 [bacterium]